MALPVRQGGSRNGPASSAYLVSTGSTNTSKLTNNQRSPIANKAPPNIMRAMRMIMCQMPTSMPPQGIGNRRFGVHRLRISVTRINIVNTKLSLVNYMNEIPPGAFDEVTSQDSPLPCPGPGLAPSPRTPVLGGTGIDITWGLQVKEPRVRPGRSCRRRTFGYPSYLSVRSELIVMTAPSEPDPGL